MQLNQLEYLIAHLSVNNQMVQTKIETWSPFENHNPDLHNLNKEIFGDQTSIQISRDRIYNEVNPVKKILLTYYWGYPGSGRGNNFLNIINPDNFALLRELLVGLSCTELSSQAFIALDRIHGVGPSTLTKLLYFFNVRLDGKKCLILDDRIKKVIKKKYFDEFNQLHFRSGATTFDEYRTYNNIMHKLSRLMKVEPDQLELFLFLFPSD